MVLKGFELREDDERRNYKCRVVFQGDNVVNQDWPAAIFQALGSFPASMQASKMTDAYPCLPGKHLQQADAEQAYVQATLEGERRLIRDRPCVRMRKAPHGHPDAGSCWEGHRDREMKKARFEQIDNWPSC